MTKTSRCISLLTTDGRNAICDDGATVSSVFGSDVQLDNKTIARSGDSIEQLESRFGGGSSHKSDGIELVDFEKWNLVVEISGGKALTFALFQAPDAMQTISGNTNMPSLDRLAL